MKRKMTVALPLLLLLGAGLVLSGCPGKKMMGNAPAKTATVQQIG